MTATSIENGRHVAGLELALDDAQLVLDMLGGTHRAQVFADNKAFHIQAEHFNIDDAFAPRLADLNARGAGVFVTVNQTDGKGRSDSNIIKVRAFFVDLDGAPLENIARFPLRPHMIIESSPGRWHVYFLVTGCPLDRFSSIQARLARLCGGDPKVIDLPRVMRLPGFIHRKGEPFISHVFQVNNHANFTFEQFEAALPAEAAPVPVRPIAPTRADVYERARRWVEKVDPAIQGQDGSGKTFNVAMVLVERFALPEHEARIILGEYGARCRPPWSTKEINHKLADAIRKIDPSRLGEKLREGKTTSSDVVSAKQAQGCASSGKATKRPAYMTSADLMGRQIQPILWAMVGLLPEGLVVLGGRPKSGKSYLAMDGAVSVSMGRRAYGWFETAAADALYLALEDSPGRLQRRLDPLLRGNAPPAGLCFATEFPILDDAGFIELDRFVKDRPATRLIVIDTIQKLMPPRPRDADEYTWTYSVLSRLQRFALDHRICIVTVTHTKKTAGDDVFTSIMGTTGWIAAADAILVLIRNKDNTGRLHLTGRDVETMTFDLRNEKGAWIVERILDETDESQAQKAAAWLRKFLEGAGQPTKVVFESASSAGHSANAIREAKSIAGVKSRKSGLSGGWFWVLERGAPSGNEVEKEDDPPSSPSSNYEGADAYTREAQADIIELSRGGQP